MTLTRLAIAALLLSAGSAQARYEEECRSLADRLAREPGTLKMAELDLLKSCLSDLQRSIVLGEPPVAATPAAPPPACVPAPVVQPQCPVCPKAEPAACPKPVAPREKPRDNDDRRLKPYLPTY